MKPTRADAAALFHEGVLALADIEKSGFRVNMAYLDKAINETEQEINRLEAKLVGDKIWVGWKKRFRDKAKLGSGKQLKVVLQDLGYEIHSKDVTDEALSNIELPFARRYSRRKKLIKARSTYLLGIRNEVVDEYLHCFFNLHLVRSFRSSADTPNLQNIPVRDPWIGELVRQAFIPRDGHQLLEVDYSALEVRGIACYSLDPVLIDFIKKGEDPHIEWAKECFLLPQDQVNKDVRFYAKNQFVFPQFYGSYYVDCSNNLWKAIDDHNLTTKDGVGLKEHLKQQGIKKLGKLDPQLKPSPGSYEHLIKQVEEKFRYKRYKVHTQWREDQWETYKRKGYIDTLTGFRLGEVYRRNQIINLPIQSSCFHCLLWSLITLNKWLKDNKFKTRIVCQIHDSMILDVWPPELEDVMHMTKRIATKLIRKQDLFRWLVVPLDVEAELCAVDDNWYNKRKVEFAN